MRARPGHCSVAVAAAFAFATATSPSRVPRLRRLQPCSYERGAEHGLCEPVAPGEWNLALAPARVPCGLQPTRPGGYDEKEMNASEIIQSVVVPDLRIIHYPDPRLRDACVPVDAVDERVRDLVERMFELMFEHRGVGLAAPQVGLNVRLFVASPSFDPADRCVYINPRIVGGEGKQEEEEGCLSLPGIYCKIKRFQTVTIEAADPEGRRFEETCSDFHARIVQHENDHLDGMLLTDRMSPVAKMGNRKLLKGLEDEFAAV